MTNLPPGTNLEQYRTAERTRYIVHIAEQIYVASFSGPNAVLSPAEAYQQAQLFVDDMILRGVWP